VKYEGVNLKLLFNSIQDRIDPWLTKNFSAYYKIHQPKEHFYHTIALTAYFFFKI